MKRDEKGFIIVFSNSMVYETGISVTIDMKTHKGLYNSKQCTYNVCSSCIHQNKSGKPEELSVNNKFFFLIFFLSLWLVLANLLINHQMIQK